MLMGFIPSIGQYGSKQFPVVMGTATNADLATTASYPCTLPSGILAGEILIIVFTQRRNAAISATTPTGWTLLNDLVGSSNLRHQYIYWKVADGSEGTSVTITQSSAASVSSSIAYRISGGTSVECGTGVTGGSGTSIDPPSLTPSWGLDKTLWITACSFFDAASGQAFTAPTNYTSVVISNGDNGNESGPATSQRSFETATENPGAGTWQNSTLATVGQTIAVKPV